MGCSLGMYYFNDQVNSTICLCDKDSEVEDDTCFDALVNTLIFIIQENTTLFDLSLSEQKVAWAIFEGDDPCEESVIHLPSRAPPIVG